MHRASGLKLISSLFAATCILMVSAQGSAGSWSVKKTIPLGGVGGWDYLKVDEPGRRLFVTHANHVIVLDLKNDRIVGMLESLGAHGVAFAPELNRGFISNGGGGTVTIFNLTTLKPIQSVKVGENPDAICYEPLTKRVFAFNGRSHTASVLDATQGTLLGGIPLPGKPEFAQADGKGFVFDNIEDKALVIKIDAARMKIITTWPLPGESAPSALAIDAFRHRLFVGCGAKRLYVLDSISGRTLATLSIGNGVDAVAYDPVGKHLFASCGDGTLTIIDQVSADVYAPAVQVTTERGARTMAFDSATQTAYLPIATFGPPPTPTAEQPHPRPAIVPGTLRLLVVRP